MADLWGILAIARRLGISKDTLYRWHRRDGVPMYRRHKRGQPGLVWYSNDRLLTAYELGRAAQDRDAWLADQTRASVDTAARPARPRRPRAPRAGPGEPVSR